MFNFIYRILIHHFEKKLEFQRANTLRRSGADEKEIIEIDKDLKRLSEVRQKIV